MVPMPVSQQDRSCTQSAPEDLSSTYGHVSLVGAGPGDPELLTLRALRRLEAADVVLHDSLLSEDVLGLVPASAELINVGKRCGDPKDRGLQQQEIHQLMLSNSRRGRRVVRLKCGDPFVFGRGGEEVEFLAKYGILAEVVPGITSAVGASASCLMPLTHRDLRANHVHLVVGQNKAKALPELDWASLAQGASSSTVVFYMGLKNLDSICETLLRNGAPPKTPMAVVESASLPEEQIVHGTVDSMPDTVKKQLNSRGGPVLILMGPTAAFPAHLERLAGERPLKRARPTPACESVC